MNGTIFPNISEGKTCGPRAKWAAVGSSTRDCGTARAGATVRFPKGGLSWATAILRYGALAVTVNVEPKMSASFTSDSGGVPRVKIDAEITQTRPEHLPKSTTLTSAWVQDSARLGEK
jgi:hypothetical protein